MPLLEAEFWVAVGFFLFVGVLVYFGIPQKMLAALDSRGARVKAELDDAKRLRDEAEALLAQYRRKRQEAEREADEIIAGARAEAERVAAEAKTRMEEFVARRSQVAEAKIAQAETQAVADVRAAAAEAAVAAAEKILTQSTKGEVADRLLAQGIRDVKAKLN
jgi:F-type H+-transporting ATPase subunit b